MRTVSRSDIDALVHELVDACRTRRDRYILGVTGPPGSGKSSLANQIVERAAGSVGACVAPMDGFHRSNEQLAAMGLLALKGVPDSFDAGSFVAHLELLRGTDPVAWPTFDRARETTVPNGRLIPPDTQLVVVEGNYLLLDAPPWDDVRHHLDAVWYLDVPDDVLIARLVTRHELARSPDDARAKVESTDLPNARLVAETRHRADIVIG